MRNSFGELDIPKITPEKVILYGENPLFAKNIFSLTATAVIQRIIKKYPFILFLLMAVGTVTLAHMLQRSGC
jgi:hypothetical protein